MLCNILPDWLYKIIIENYDIECLYEIRIRLEKPIIVNYKGEYNYLKTNSYNYNKIIANNDLINYIIAVATKQSIYAYNNQIKNCYITTDGGIRIGLCGTAVYDNAEVSTIKNITSLNIRVSHEVKNCSNKIINMIMNYGDVRSTLIISPPGAGKTTLVRDIVSKLSNELKVQNILVVDERYEIAGLGYSKFNLGESVDVISGSDKSFAFKNVIKTMCPSVIVTDEVSKEKDIEEIKQTIKSGVRVVATAHAKNILDLKNKKYFSNLIEDKYFERIIVLSKRNGVGTIESVYDENLKMLYFPSSIWK